MKNNENLRLESKKKRILLNFPIENIRKIDEKPQELI